MVLPSVGSVGAGGNGADGLQGGSAFEVGGVDGAGKGSADGDGAMLVPMVAL